MTATRIHMSVGCVFGALGVALWAWATHAGQTSATIAAQMLLIHAAALVALTALRITGLLAGRMSVVLISVLALGVALFSGDLAMRAMFGNRLFPMASPIGGSLMIMAWLGLAIMPFVPSRS